MESKHEYKERDIAYEPYLQICYNKLINAAKRGESLKKVEMVRLDLQSQLSKLSNSELTDFHSKVRKHLKDIENRMEIRRLRVEVSKIESRILELKEESGEDDYKPKEMKR